MLAATNFLLLDDAALRAAFFAFSCKTLLRYFADLQKIILCCHLQEVYVSMMSGADGMGEGSSDDKALILLTHREKSEEKRRHAIARISQLSYKYRIRYTL